MKDWDQFFIEMAMHVATKSKDPSTKVGCVIVGEGNVILSVGFNGFPRGVNEHMPERWERPGKYSWICHAEANAVFNAARHGIKLQGARAYLNWDPRPCATCTQALIQSGVVEIIGPDRPFVGKGAGINYSLDFADVMCSEAGVTRREVTFYG